MAGHVDLALQSVENLLQLLGQMRLVLDAVEIDHELVAAEAADVDHAGGEGCQPLGHGIDQAVADGMAERVVDALEIVAVDDREPAQALAVAGGHGFGDDLVEIGAVHQPGQAS